MQVFNYGEHSAEGIAQGICSFERKADVTQELDGRTAKRVEAISSVISKWFSLNPEPYKSAEGRAVMKLLNTALVYMGGKEGLYGLDIGLYNELKEAQIEEERGRITEEISFWNTVLRLVLEELSPDSFSLGMMLVNGCGCEADPERAEKIYGNWIFSRYEALSGGQKACFKDINDGASRFVLSDITARTCDALVRGDREAFTSVFFDAYEQKSLKELEQVLSFIHLVRNHPIRIYRAPRQKEEREQR